MNINEAREYYRKINQSSPNPLTEREIDLVIIRGLCMHRNRLFIQERDDLLKIKKKGAEFQKAERAFLNRWGIFRNEIALIEGRPVVSTYSPDPGKAWLLRIEVDLRQSKDRIKEKIEMQIDKHHAMYREDYPELKYDWLSVEFEHQEQGKEKYDAFKGRRLAEDKSAMKPKKRVEDYEYCIDCLRVWDLKQAHTWPGVAELAVEKQIIQYDMSTIQGSDAAKERVRNYKRAIDRLIKNGLPGFKAFPNSEEKRGC